MPGSVWFAMLYGMLAWWHFCLTGRTLVDHLAKSLFHKKVKFGELGLLQARTFWLDDVVEAFVKRHGDDDQIFNIVILGAGYDTRCYRLDGLLQKGHGKLYKVGSTGSRHNKKRC